MGIYLRDHPPLRPQFRSPRRARLSGAIVVHVADSPADLLGEDRGAENVANFIRNRTEPGSYHDLVDRDSIIQLVDYDDEAYHDGTGGNRWSLGLSAAVKPADWVRMSAKDRSDVVENMAVAAARQAAHVHARTGIVVPAGRITAAQYRAGAAGFVSHAELDPTRRSDPGLDFPWTLFLRRFTIHRDRLLGFAPNPDPQEGLTMAQADEINQRIDRLRDGTLLLVRALQRVDELTDERIDRLRDGVLLGFRGAAAERAELVAALDELQADKKAARSELVELLELAAAGDPEG